MSAVLVILNYLIILLRNACSVQRSQPSLPIAGWTARRAMLDGKTRHPHVAVTIDEPAWPYKILYVRGSRL